MTENTTWINWSVRTSHLSDDPISLHVLSVPGLGSPFSVPSSTFPVLHFTFPILHFTFPVLHFTFPVLHFTFPVPTVRYHCCLIMLSVTFHMQLRLTTCKAVCKLKSKTCQVVEHHNRCEEGKIIIFLLHEEVLSCETHRYLALELKK